MTLQKLRYFVTVVDEQSFSKAASKLYIAQPSLSSFLSKLENELGVKLLNRGGKQLKLTPAGEVYYKGAVEILEKYDSVCLEVENIRKEREETLRLGVTGQRCLRYVAKVLPLFYKDLPKVRVVIFEKPARELQKMILSNDLDACVSAQFGENSELEKLPLQHEELVLAIPNGHPLEKKGRNLNEELLRMPISAFKDDPFVMLKEHTVMRSVIEDYCFKMNFKPNIHLEVESQYTSLLMTTNSIALSFFPAKQDPRSMGIKFIALEEPIFYDIALFYRKGEPLSRPLKILTGHLRDNKFLL